jgi:hypothetical protein
VSAWGVHVQEVAKSAELTLSLTKDLSSGQSGVILMALEMRGNLDKTNVSDEAIDEFLDNYELVDMAYHHHLSTGIWLTMPSPTTLGRRSTTQRSDASCPNQEVKKPTLRWGARVGARSRHFIPPDHCDQARSRYALAPV